MATYTREQLVRALLTEIGALDANEAPDASDAELANERTQQKMEELYEEGLIPFDIDGDIPARYFLPLVGVIAVTLVLPFGKVSRATALAQNATAGDRALRKLRQRAYVPTTTPATYF